MTEAATWVFFKIRIPKSSQNPKKNPVKEFTFTKVAGLRHATRLKMNSSTAVCQPMCNKIQFLFIYIQCFCFHFMISFK